MTNKFNVCYPIPDHVIPWIKDACSLFKKESNDNPWDKDPASDNAPWRSRDGEVRFIVTIINAPGGNLVNISSGENKHDFPSAQEFMGCLLRQIGNTFVIWGMVWTNDYGDYGVSVMNLLREEWKMCIQSLEEAEALRYEYHMRISSLCIK